MSAIIREKHKDRYRIQFCNENYYLEHQSLFKVWKNRFETLNSIEKLQAWVVVLSCLRRPNDWYGGPRKFGICSRNNHSHSLNITQAFLGSPIKVPQKLPSNLDVFELLNFHRIKALPESCFRSLCLMVDGTYPLRLSSGVVSPFDLLQIQIKGERIVSMDEDFEAWPTRLYSGRDYLGFILHDLIHADHFFHEATHRDAQMGFYFFVNSLLDDKDLMKLLCNVEFRKGFEYIISDMNSHPLHLFQTLHSVLFKAVNDDITARTIWQNWVGAQELSSTETTALLSVNTTDFELSHAETVAAYSLSRGRAKKKGEFFQTLP